MRAVARALAAFHVGAERCGDEAPAAPLALAKRLRADADGFEARPHGADADAALERLLAEQQRFLIDGIETLLARAASGSVRRIHGHLDCRSVLVNPAREARFAKGGSARVRRRRRRRGRARDRPARARARRASPKHSPPPMQGRPTTTCSTACSTATRATPRCAWRSPRLRARNARRRGPAPAAYLRAALDAAHPAPLVIAIGGAVATGKSTLARVVSRRLAAPRVEADRVGHALLAPLPDGVAQRRIWEGDFAERVYLGMLRRADDVLAGGRPVVLDACYADARRRAEAAALAARHGVEFVFVHCDAPPEQVEARLARRDSRDGGPDGGWPAIARSVTEQWQAPGAGRARPARAHRHRAPAARVAARARTRHEGPAVRSLPTAVTFDCWNTLLREDDWHEAHRRRVDALLHAARETGAHADFEQAGRAFDGAWQRHMDLWAEGRRERRARGGDLGDARPPRPHARRELRAAGCALRERVALELRRAARGRRGDRRGARARGRSGGAHLRHGPDARPCRAGASRATRPARGAARPDLLRRGGRAEAGCAHLPRRARRAGRGGARCLPRRRPAPHRRRRRAQRRDAERAAARRARRRHRRCPRPTTSPRRTPSCARSSASR